MLAAHAFRREAQRLQGLIARITLDPEDLEIGIRTAYVGDMLRRGEKFGAYQPNALPDQPILVLTIAAPLKRTGMEKKFLIGGTNERSQTKADAGLLKLIARAHKLMADTRAPIEWHEQRAGLGFN